MSILQVGEQGLIERQISSHPQPEPLHLIFHSLFQHSDNSLSVSLFCAVLMQQLVLFFPPKPRPNYY